MLRTPVKQPVAADKQYVDVYYLKNRGLPPHDHVSVTSCAVMRHTEGFPFTVDAIMDRGIMLGIGDYLPPSAIIRIKDRD